MSYKCDVPEFKGENDFKMWKREVGFWLKLIEDKVPVEKRALLLMLKLNFEAKKVAMQIPDKDLEKADGVKLLLSKLDSHYKIDEQTEEYLTYKKLRDFKRTPEMKMQQFVNEFKEKWLEVSASVSLDTIVAFWMIESANLSPVEQSMALTTASSLCKNSNLKLSLENIEIALKKLDFASEKSSPVVVDDVLAVDFEFDDLSAAEKYELAADVFYAKSKFKFALNPKDRQTGQPMKCHECQSRFHLLSNCPKRRRRPQQQQQQQQPQYQHQQQQQQQQQHHTEEETPPVYNVFFNQSPSEDHDGAAFAVLDCGCMKTCCGLEWFQQNENKLVSLLNKNNNNNNNNNNIKNLKRQSSDSLFRFGDHLPRKAKFSVMLPILINDVLGFVAADVVDGSVPLLISKESMSKMRMIIDFSKNSGTVLGCKTDFNVNSKGYLLVNLLQAVSTRTTTATTTTTFYVEEISREASGQHRAEVTGDHSDSVVVDIEEPELMESFDSLMNNVVVDENPLVVAQKLYLQFGHPSPERLARHWEAAEIAGVDDVMKKAVKEAILSHKCEPCVLSRKHPPRPRHVLPLANNFNDVVAIDLTDWKDPNTNESRKILHIIDTATRYSRACFIENKVSCTVVRALVKIWISVWGPFELF